MARVIDLESSNDESYSGQDSNILKNFESTILNWYRQPQNLPNFKNFEEEKDYFINSLDEQYKLTMNRIKSNSTMDIKQKRNIGRQVIEQKRKHELRIKIDILQKKEQAANNKKNTDLSRHQNYEHYRQSDTINGRTENQKYPKLNGIKKKSNQNRD